MSSQKDSVRALSAARNVKADLDTDHDVDWDDVRTLAEWVLAMLGPEDSMIAMAKAAIQELPDDHASARYSLGYAHGEAGTPPARDRLGDRAYDEGWRAGYANYPITP